jgi:anthranilate synthase component 1
MLFCCSLDSHLDLIDIAAALPQQYPYLLDSAAPGPLGQTNILFRPNGQHLCLLPSGELTGPGEGESFLDRLDHWFQQEKHTAQIHAEWPFSGGWFLYLGYELAAEIEPVVNFPRAKDEYPVAFASRCPAAVLTNHDQPGVLHLLAEDSDTLKQMQAEIEGLTRPDTVSGYTQLKVSAEPPEQFEQAVLRIHEYILDGDVFQVNLSRGWSGTFEQPADPVALYRSLRHSNPAPFAGWARWGEDILMSSSPERLVEIENGVVQSRPIAGTHPRGDNQATDEALSKEMLAHPKERAEHIMLIDLERNDLGRVCQTGTVEVDELMVVESYQHVHHIVSNVRGHLREDVTPVDVIRAVFPGGTITGCPKVRCMQIIAELEQHGRSFYTGSMGYLGLDGKMDLNILIRSMLLHQNQISFRTGAGIVADSEPEREVAETHHKARGLLRALGDLHA